MIEIHDDRISIHAPVKGATSHVYADTSRLKDFNPRSREGSDLPRNNG